MLVLISLLLSLTIGFLLWAILYNRVTDNSRINNRLELLTNLTGQNINRDDNQEQNDQLITLAMQELESMRRSKGRMTLQMRLRLAGHSGNVRSFYAIWGVSAAIVSIFVGYLSLGYSLQIVAFFLTIVVAPRIYLSTLSKRRANKLLSELPNAIEIIVRGLRSGLSLTGGLGLAESELNEPLKSELVRFRSDLSIGLSMEEAARRFARRIDSQEVNFLSTVISLQSRTGGNLAEGLDNLVKILRQREVTLAKVRAASSEARTSAWIIGSIPVIIVVANYLFAPKSIETLFVTSAGNLLLLGSLVWMGMGVLVMYSMVKIGD